jgi:hypothetical protein
LSWLILCGVLGGGALSAGPPAVYPKRMINYQQVDLMPLLTWWEQQDGERPLSSWSRVQGFLDKESPLGWLVRGTIEGLPGLQTILLKHPPREELAKYRELTALLSQLEQQRKATVPVTRMQEYQGWGINSVGGPVRLPTGNFDRIQQAKADLQDIDDHIASVQEDIAKMVDTHGKFIVDAFALRLNERYRTHAVFDFGYPPY